MSLSFSLDDIKQHFIDEIGANIDKLLFIRNFNRLLIDLNITKPAERLAKIYYSKEFRKYQSPADLRVPIGLRDKEYSQNARMRRVSPGVIARRSAGEIYAIQGNAPMTYLEILHTLSKGLDTLMTGCNSLTADGTWANVSNASNIALNTTTKHDGGGSISFDISAAASAEISFTKTSSIDASTYTEHQGCGFYIWLPTAPTQITVKWGNDSSNYYSKTVTTQANGEAFDTADENEIRVDRNDATETGSVDDSAIDYFTVTLTFASSTTDTDFLIDHIVIFKPAILLLEYYTKYVATNSSGTPIYQLTVSEDCTDIPLIFDDYLQTVIDGLAWRYFRKKKPELAEQYRRDYISANAPSGALVSGKRFLEQKYPNRTQNISRDIKLPPLYY